VQKPGVFYQTPGFMVRVMRNAGGTRHPRFLAHTGIDIIRAAGKEPAARYIIVASGAFPQIKRAISKSPLLAPLEQMYYNIKNAFIL